MLYKRNPQLNKNGELIHLLSTEGLSRDILTHILDTAANFVSVSDREAHARAPHLKLRLRVCRPM
jgi:aspartate carbamoyltransferase catalytic subunit